MPWPGGPRLPPVGPGPLTPSWELAAPCPHSLPNARVLNHRTKQPEGNVHHGPSGPQPLPTSLRRRGRPCAPVEDPPPATSPPLSTLGQRYLSASADPSHQPLRVISLLKNQNEIQQRDSLSAPRPLQAPFFSPRQETTRASPSPLPPSSPDRTHWAFTPMALPVLFSPGSARTQEYKPHDSPCMRLKQAELGVTSWGRCID